MSITDKPLPIAECECDDTMARKVAQDPAQMYNSLDKGVRHRFRVEDVLGKIVDEPTE